MACQLGSALADVRLPAIISDNMVVQCDIPVNVWGWAAPGAAISVRLSARRAETVANDDGTWRVVLLPLPAGGPWELTVSTGDRELRVRNVLIGEVWLASGQSNMAMGLSEKEIKDGAAEIAAADFPRLRLFTVDAPPRQRLWTMYPDAGSTVRR